MRSIYFLFLFIVCYCTYADEYTIFEENGYYGLKDHEGETTVPAVYDQLGWSDGSRTVIDQVLGFKKGQLWGILSVKNKEIVAPTYHSLTALSPLLLIASVKGNFSNKHFYGIVDLKGRTIVSFNYFQLRPFHQHLLASDFDGSGQVYGVITYENRVIIPLSYQRVEKNRGVYIATNKSLKQDVYARDGSVIELGLDSMVQKNKGWIAYRDGYAGFIGNEGERLFDISYKSMAVGKKKVSPMQFSTWQVYENYELMLEVKCDSMTSENGHLIAFLNGANHFVGDSSSELASRAYIIRDIKDDLLITQHSKTRKWSAIHVANGVLLQNKDSIFFSSQNIIAKEEGVWNIYNAVGTKINRFSYQKVLNGFAEQHIAQRNENWGIINKKGREVSSFKYDTIISAEFGYKVGYLNKWGAMNVIGNWIVPSEYDEITFFLDIVSGRKGYAYSLFNWKGDLLNKVTTRPLYQAGRYIVIKGDDGREGLLNAAGKMAFPAMYDSILVKEGYIELKKDGFSSVASREGKTIFSLEDQIQEVGGYSEQYFLVKKNDRWGFTDYQGRLRVSNRYDSLQVFSGGLAATFLRGKWGFIDKSEILRVQPHYDHVEPFTQQLTIAINSGFYGLIDKAGVEVVPLEWQKLERLPSGNFLVQNAKGRFGLIDAKGNFVLRPNYDQIKDFRDAVAVKSDGRWGLLSSTRHEIFQLKYRSLQIHGKYSLVQL